jgi:hypothetical protein
MQKSVLLDDTASQDGVAVVLDDTASQDGVAVVRIERPSCRAGSKPTPVLYSGGPEFKSRATD